MTKSTIRTRTLLALISGVCCATLAASTPAVSDSSTATFTLKNRSGLLSSEAKFYYLAFGTDTVSGDFLVMKQDGSWATGGSPGTGWNAAGWNGTAFSGAGVVPCFPVDANSIVTIPPNISGRFYVFQVRSAQKKLFNVPCANTPSTSAEQINGIFGNANSSSGGYAPFGYFAGGMVEPVPAWLSSKTIPIWSIGEIGSGTGAGTIDTSQVDFIGLPMNVTAKMTASPGATYPVWNKGVGFSFSPTGKVNMAAATTSYANFVNRLPVVARNGGYTINVRSNFAKLKTTIGPDTVLFNPGNYISSFNSAAFRNFFLNLINNYMWYPGAPSVGGLPAVLPWTGNINTGGVIPPTTGLPQTTFEGTAVTLPAAGTTDPNKPPYPNYSGTTPLQAIRFVSSDTGTVAYVLSPVSYQVLCKAGAATSGCGSPAAQVFAGNGALAQPGDANQFALLSPSEQDAWTQYGGQPTYNLIVARLGLVISAAFNRGVAGGLTTPGGLCQGAATLNDCWGNQTFWYPTPRTASERKKYFQGDTTQNHFSRWLHTAQIAGIPMMTQPINPTTLSSGATMGMGYGFSNDENPTPQPPGASQTPSKFDGNVSMAPSTDCNFITIMPWKGKVANLSPVALTGCSPDD